MIFTKLKRLMCGISQKVGIAKTKLMLSVQNQSVSPTLGIKERIFCLISAIAASVQGFMVNAFASDLGGQLDTVTNNFFEAFGPPIAKLGILIGIIGLGGMFLTQDKKREAFKAVFIGGVVAFVLFMGGNSSLAHSLFESIKKLSPSGGTTTKTGK